MLLIALIVAHLGAHADPILSFERILARPLEARVQTLRRLTPAQTTAFISVAFDSRASLSTRWRAVTAMGRLDQNVYRPVIARALASPEWYVRNAALIANLNDDRDRAIARATAALNDPALVVRTQAVRNLIHLNARRAEPILWRALNDARSFSARGESLWIRAHVAEALAKFAGPGRTKAFQKLLSDEDPRVHRWAVRGLESTSGFKLTESGDSVETARRKWLARLGDDLI